MTVYGYARVSTDGLSVDAQLQLLAEAECKKTFREIASGAKAERAQLGRAIPALNPESENSPRTSSGRLFAAGRTARH